MADVTIQSQIDSLMKQEKWRDLIAFLSDAIRISGQDDHWLITRLSMAYLEARDYQRALEHAETAFSLAHNCPLVLWDLAGALDMCGKHSKAIGIWEELLARGVDNIAADKCGEGTEWANTLISDCYYRIADSCLALDLSDKARVNRNYFAERLASGAGSIYNEDDLIELDKSLGKKRGRES